MSHVNDAEEALRVCELLGLEGSYSFSEKILQRIWWTGDFEQGNLRTQDGCRLELLWKGRWNRLKGPDFKGARLLIDGSLVEGDVELHLHAADWNAHGHALDRAYDRVVLHVVLFPPEEGWLTRNFRDEPLPTLVMLPLLPQDLEAYALDDAAESLAGRLPRQLFELLAQLGAAELEARLQEKAQQRWVQKRHFAERRLAKVPWSEACHRAALDCLGFRNNRVPMTQVAHLWPLENWIQGRVSPEAVYETQTLSWREHGCRPANRPLPRLRQYATWCARRPNWPETLECLGEDFAETSKRLASGESLPGACFAHLRRRVKTEICGDALGGARLDSMICDIFLPLLSFQKSGDLEPLWSAWPVGDLPAELRRLLSDLYLLDPGLRVKCNGLAQALLALSLDLDEGLLTTIPNKFGIAVTGTQTAK